MTTLDQAIAQMRAMGMPDFPPGHPRVNTGRIVRYGPKLKGWYRLKEYPSRNGNRYVFGDYGLWGEIEPAKIETDWSGIDEIERTRIAESQAQIEARERAKRAERALYASRRGEQQWKDARKVAPEGVATYLDRKGVVHEVGIRYAADGTVLVPMIRYDITETQQEAEGYTGPRRLVGLQKIAPDGTKRFNKGIGMEGAACRLGGRPKTGEPILITEGLATGLTLRMATSGAYAVFVAFNAGNIPRVAQILRALYPTSAILLCADDDAYLASSLNKLLRENFGASELIAPPLTERALNTKHGPGLVSAEWTADANGVQGIVGALRFDARTYTLSRSNAGRTYAHRAAAAVGNAAVVYPVFAQRALPIEPELTVKLTDFNDLHHTEGLEVVRAQLAGEIERLELARQVRAIIKESAREVKAAKAKPEKKKPAGDMDWERFFERFTLIYPTDTVWDAEYRRIVKLTPMRIHFGNGVINWWLASPQRRTVNAEQVVFDPSMRAGPECINLFNGMPMKPVAGECGKILALLQHLCGEADQDQCPVMEWVLKWLAYPLQHPGAKMESAIVMHGATEGTGKNLFFRPVREIYGEYSSLITQAELESPYNSWISQRLFIIANEVISRSEMRHHVGRLKNYITESPIPVSEKFLPLRYEDNHMNAVFLTNDLHALQISPGDRRYMVVLTPGGLSAGFYEEVVAEIEAGGAAALYHYLMQLPLDDFDEHTKPLLTAAKEALIEQSYNSAQFYQVQLKSGEIGDVPYCCCLTLDCYELYTTWCQRTGHRNPLPLNRFSHEFMAMNGVRRIDKARVVDPDRATEHALPRSALKQKSIFEMGVRPDDQDEGKWRDEGVAAFREAMKQYLRGRRGRHASDGEEQQWNT